MQITLPIGTPIDKNVLSVGVLLLAGISVLPLSYETRVGYSENQKGDEVVQITPQTFNERDFIQTMLIRPENPSVEKSSDFRREVRMEVNKVTKELNNEQSSKIASLNRGSNGVGMTEQIVKSAKAWIGVPYRYGGTTTQGVDCSGLVQNVFMSYGIELPRTSQEQFRSGVGVPLSQLKLGDLVFFSTSGPGASHVGIYIGNQEFVSATREKVEIQSLDQPYWKSTYRGSRRVIQ